MWRRWFRGTNNFEGMTALFATRWRRVSQAGPQRRIRPPSADLHVQQLETRLTPSLSTLASFGAPGGTDPQGGVIMDNSGNLFGIAIDGGAFNDGTIFELEHGSGRTRTLASFNGTGEPGALIMDRWGDLFGTTSTGGALNGGTVFELAHGSDTLVTVASFDVANGLPQGGLVMDNSGNLYGTRSVYGASAGGNIFELAYGSDTITTLASFDSTSGVGQVPNSGLVMDSNGSLYGTTFDGTVFELADGSNTITKLATLKSANGRGNVGLAIDSSGNLYGAASAGGEEDVGAIFELAKGGDTVTTLASFDLSNDVPNVGLVVDSGGNLFGTSGGSGFEGKVFELPTGSHTITTLASFDRASGAFPTAGPIMDSNGNLFGTTTSEITDVPISGTVFELAHGSGAITTLASFDSYGAGPFGDLIMDNNGNLYGTTSGGIGHGTVFQFGQASDTITTLGVFAGSQFSPYPSGGLAVDSTGNLYGTTVDSGLTSPGDGAIVELAQGSGMITTLASFNGTNPNGALITDSSGNLYGTTLSGGIWNLGTVFELAKGSGAITTLASFNGANGSPSGHLIMDSSGNLFGLTESSVFELAHNFNTINTLASFNGPNGAQPAGLVMDSSGNLYGTTYAGGASNEGTVFELANSSGTVTTLASFDLAVYGAGPGAVILDVEGNLFGTTAKGGASGDGTLFEVAHGSAKIATLASFDAIHGPVAPAGLIVDSSGNLYGTTSSGGATGEGSVFELRRDTPQLLVSIFQAPVTAGVAHEVTVTVENAYGFPDQDYTGTVYFASGDGQASLPKPYTFTPVDAGVHTFSVTFNTTGTQSLSASDSAMPTLTNSQTGILVYNSTQRYVNQVYLDLLQRPADVAGLASWSSLIDSGKLTRFQVAQAISHSAEFNTNLIAANPTIPPNPELPPLPAGNNVPAGPVIEGFFQEYLHRGSNGNIGLITALQAGVSIEGVQAAIFGSAEYYQDAGGTNAGFLAHLYVDILDRPIDDGSLVMMEQAMAQGISAQAVAGSVLQSAEYHVKLVGQYYLAFLRRPLDPIAANAWVAELQAGTSTFQVMASILASDEYYDLASRS
jgi:uncharacterized repeat protein (TIGR03803 family)